MADALKTLIKSRSTIKGQITRLNNYVRQIENLDIPSLESRKVKLEEYFVKFCSVQDEIEASEESSQQEEIRKEFEELYYECGDFLSRELYKLSNHTTNVEPNKPSGSAAIASQQATNSLQSIIPKIHIKPFDGNYADWHSFYDTFRSLVHENDSISTVHKFHLLKSYLVGNAANATNSLQASEEHYEVLWALVQKRFNKPRKIVQSHIRALFELPQVVKDSPSSLRNLIEAAEMHVAALKSLKQPTDWDEMLIYIITAKLDKQIRTAWDRTLEDHVMPKFSELLAFLDRYSRDDEPIQLVCQSRDNLSRKQIDKPTKLAYKTNTFVSTSSNLSCALCKQTHYINQCEKLLKLTPRDRLKPIKSLKLCINCLRGNHQTPRCHASVCRQCKGRHHTLLHFDNETVVRDLKEVEQSKNIASTSVSLISVDSSEVLLATARVKILDRYNRSHDCRILLDPGSQSNFITETFANQLQLTKREVNIPILGLGQHQSCSNYYVQSRIMSRNTNFSCEAKFLILPNITSRLPSRTVNFDSLNIPSNISLADPEFNRPANIDALLGEYLYYKLLCSGQIRLCNETAVLQETHLGWVVSGEVKTSLNVNAQTKCFLVTNQVDSILTKFWELEECPRERMLSPEEEKCEEIFRETTQRNDSGRYIVRLPFNDKKDQLGQSYRIALKRFFSLERKLHNSTDLYDQYAAFLEEYKKLGHMTDITNSEQVDKGCYLPHHAVIKASSLTTKVRVVFDGSAETENGISLNDCLMVGPTIQDDVFSIVTRFRSHTYVLTADIEKMFRQILLHPEDAIFHKILWRKNPSQSLKTYRLDTVTYGTKTAPFLAVRSLHELAKDESKDYPKAAEVLKSDFYMDDLLTGTDTLEEAIVLRDQLINILKAGGFNLRQWASNEPSLIDSLQDCKSDQYLYLDTDTIKKTLGISWHPRDDLISYTVNVDIQKVRATKRNILSRIAKFFDPLGLLGPVIIRTKLIMQQLWKCGTGWDDIVPSDIYSLWKTYEDQLPLLKNFTVSRHLLIKNYVEIQLHGFCDASEIAYGACLYLRSMDVHGNIAVRLIAGKSRVAPLKTTSLPRLELCAADLLSVLYQTVSSALRLSLDSVNFWSDSTIALHWINSPPHTLKTFVANRVSKIQTRTNCKDWKHVASADNPADYISRGQLPIDFLQNRLWLEGPVWLSEAPATWPKNFLPDIDIPERRAVVTLLGCTNPSLLFERYSSIGKLQRIIAYCIRFCKNASRFERNLGPLTTFEIHRAHQIIIKCIQRRYFFKEVQDLENKGFVCKESKIFILSPFLDEDKIIRVGGCLKNSNIQYSQKHPILLPRSDHITRIIILNEHYKHMHTGILGTLNAVRQRYWPIDGKNITRAVIHKCLRCFRVEPKNVPEYPMGNLPKDRVTKIRPFQVVGVDYCGPLYIKEKKHRNTKKLKVYIAVFICFATKAVHLEVVSDLSTEALLASLRRFFARRGYAHTIYSDNGTNFVGAKNSLDELISLLKSKEHNDLVVKELAHRGISWHFSPPRSPHFGGLWEAAVKGFKHHLARTVGDTLLTFEELNTYVIEIEAILNSRLLTSLSIDPNDLVALTPAHYLIGEPLTSPPEHDWTDTPSNRLSIWQHLQKIKQHFWSRWYKDYLNEINIRSKWRNNPVIHLRVGTLVLLKEENLPPMRWCLGRIVKIHPGNDNVIRVVTVKTIDGIYKRGVKNICVLPIDDNFEQQITS